jgi:hypothetical protein
LYGNKNLRKISNNMLTGIKELKILDFDKETV